jgi:hypothetical protein
MAVLPRPDRSSHANAVVGRDSRNLRARELSPADALPSLRCSLAEHSALRACAVRRAEMNWDPPESIADSIGAFAFVPVMAVPDNLPGPCSGS